MKRGSGLKGEYRGFPNAVHRQDGNYFHAMNSGTDPSVSKVDIQSDNHVKITFTSGNRLWEGQWDFYPDRCDFTMSKVSPGYKYWVQYEGVPGGTMDSTDFWYRSGDSERHPIEQQSIGDLACTGMDGLWRLDCARLLFVLHHGDDEHPDDYVSRPDMTVLGFGRRNKDKFLTAPATFSIGFVETSEYAFIDKAMRQLRN